MTATRPLAVSRRIEADPTSTALLLAAPAALELWPGVRRVGEVGGRALVEADLSPHQPAPAAATVRALPPQRTPTAFVTRFAWTGSGLPAASGTLTLGYAPGAGGTPATLAALELTFEPSGGRLTRHDLQEMARGFLANLAEAAESRSRAA